MKTYLWLLLSMMLTTMGSAETDKLGQDPSWTYIDIIAPGSMHTSINGINDKNQIVGWYWDTSFRYHGFLRSEKGRWTTYDLPQGWTSSSFTAFELEDLNNNGDIIGTYFTSTGQEFTQSVLIKNGKFTKLSIPNAQYVFASAINDKGDIAGNYYVAGDPRAYGFVIDGKDGAHHQEIVTIVGPDGTGVNVTGIDDQGRVIGVLFSNSGDTYTSYPFIWVDGTFTTISGAPSTVSIFPLGFSSDGKKIAGEQHTLPYYSDGFLLTNGTFLTIHYPGQVAGHPTDVNNEGNMVGVYSVGYYDQEHQWGPRAYIAIVD